MRKLGIDSLKVLYSKEEPIERKVDNSIDKDVENALVNKRVPGSISFVPSVAGLIIAGEVVKDIIKGGE